MERKRRIGQSLKRLPPRTESKAKPATADLAPAQMGQARQKLLDNPHDRALPSSRLSTRLQQGLVITFVVIVFLALVLIGVDRWRRGGMLLGGALIYLSVIRQFVDSRVLGVLAVRSRRFDSFFAGTIGALMLLIAVSIDPLGS